jgi:alpha/beta superfamily hydrolase
VSRIESLRIPGPSGPLEAILKLPAGGGQAFAALVCHPHPLEGGTMHNKVVFNVAKALGELGAPVLRFNFRGVGASAGTYDHGVGEREDVWAALDWLARRCPGLPLCLGGFSFGAWVSSALGCEDERVTQVLAIGAPIRMLSNEGLLACRKRKLFVQGEADEFGPPAELQAFFERLPEPKALATVAGADHFFTGRQDELRRAIERYFAAEGPPPPLTQTVRERGPSNSQR